jgi:hypothetical protein
MNCVRVGPLVDRLEAIWLRPVCFVEPPSADDRRDHYLD